MAIQEWSEDAILVDPPDGRFDEELNQLAQHMQQQGGRDVVLDFTHVHILNSSCLAALLQLRTQLSDGGNRLVLCNVSKPTRGVLSVTRLEEIFEITGDRFDALATVRHHP